MIKNQNKQYTFGNRVQNGLLFAKHHNSFLVRLGSGIQAGDKGIRETYDRFRIQSSRQKGPNSSGAGINVH